MSMTVLPLLSPPATPFSPNNTFSTSGVSGTMMMTMSDFCATSFAFAQAVPPAAVSSAGTLVRELRKSLWPPLIKLAPMGLPMMPSPMHPMFAIVISLPLKVFKLHRGSGFVFLKPAQTVNRFARRLVFAADPALVAELVNMRQQVVVIDFPGAGLVPAGRVG